MLLRTLGAICIVAVSFMVTLLMLDYWPGSDSTATYASQFVIADDIAAARINFDNSAPYSSFSGVNVDVGTYSDQPVIFVGVPSPGRAQVIRLADLKTGKPAAAPSVSAFCGINPSRSIAGKIVTSSAENCKAQSGPVITYNGCLSSDLEPRAVEIIEFCDTGATWVRVSGKYTLYSGFKSGSYAPRVGGIADYDGDGQDDFWIIWPDRQLACLITEASAKAHANNQPNAIALPGGCAVTVTVPRSYLSAGGSAASPVVGWSLFAADYDKDGKPDFVLAAPHAFNGRGAVFIVPGALIALHMQTHENISVDAPGVVRLVGKRPQEWLGSLLLSAARDVIGDPTPDLVLGEQSDRANGSNQGAIVIIDGSVIGGLIKKAAPAIL